jgi:hypothetical protein
MKHQYEIVEVRNEELTHYSILNRYGSNSRVLTYQELNKKIDLHRLPKKLQPLLLKKGTAFFGTVQDARTVIKQLKEREVQLNRDKNYYYMESFLCGFDDLILGNVEAEKLCRFVANHFKFRLDKVGFWKKDVGTTYIYAGKIMLPNYPSILMTCHELAHLLDLKERGTSKHDAPFFNCVVKILTLLSYRSGTVNKVKKIVFKRDGTINVELKNKAILRFSGSKKG